MGMYIFGDLYHGSGDTCSCSWRSRWWIRVPLILVPWGIERLWRHRCVVDLRGRRKGGGIEVLGHEVRRRTGRRIVRMCACVLRMRMCVRMRRMGMSVMRMGVAWCRIGCILRRMLIRMEHLVGGDIQSLAGRAGGVQRVLRRKWRIGAQCLHGAPSAVQLRLTGRDQVHRFHFQGSR